MANLKDLLVSGAAKLLSTLRVSGDTRIDGTLYLNGAIGSSNQLVYVDSTGKFVAGKDLSNVTNINASGAIANIARTANATTYTVTTLGGADSILATPVAASTKNYMAYYTDAYNIGGTSYVQHLGHAAATKTGYIDGLLITGTTYNAATELISGVEGQLSYGDPGPQIRFTDAGQKGAIIFSRFDTSSGMNAAFHFVTDDGSANAAVKANGLIARANAMIGGNSINNSYTLYVNGNTFQNGIIYGRHTNNYFDGKLNSSNEGIGWRINPRLGIGIDPSTSYHLYVGGPARINGDLTVYRAGTTAQNYPARIQLSVNDSTTTKTENVTIAAYNSHGANGDGAHLYMQAGSSIEIYAGDGAHSAIQQNFAGTTAENLWLGTDGAIYLYGNGGTAANRVGVKITSGNVLPQKAEAANNNVQNLGASNNRWAKLYIGTADSYGSEYEPIWWNSGVPTKVTDNALLVNLGAYVAADTDETYAASVWRSKPRPGVYGVLPTTGGGTGNNSFTASRLVYSNTATKLATGNIVSEGNYISKVTYLTINGEHQTTNRLQVGGQAWIAGPLRIGDADVAQTDSATNNGYAVANRGSTNYIVFYGVNGDGPGTYSHTYIGERLYQSPTSTAEKSELLLFHGNDVGGIDDTVNSTVAGSGPDRIRVLSQQFQVDVLTSALGGTWDAVGEATNREPAFVVNATSGIQLGNNTNKYDAVNLTHVYGHVLIDPTYNTHNSYSEGLRINRDDSNGHATIALGGAKDSIVGTSTAVWYIGAYSATAGAASTFHITNNGSNGNVTNSLHGGTNGGWWLYSRLSINTTTNANWNFYVNGSSALNGTTRQYGRYIIDNASGTNDMYFDIMGRANTTTLEATSTTTYTSIAGDPWQRWSFRAPRIIHTYATAGDSSSAVTDTYDRRNYAEIRLYSYDNNTLAREGYFEAYRIGNRPTVDPDLIENHYYDLWSTKSLQADDWTANRFLFADIWDSSHASSITRIKSSTNMRIYNDVDITYSSKVRKYNGIKIWGTRVGNTVADLISGIAGVMRYGDTGPRIRFGGAESDGSDDAEILFTNHDSAGLGASLHFLGRAGDSNEGGDLVVTMPKLVVRTRATIGYNFIDDNYGLKIGRHGGIFLSPSGDATFEIYDVTNTEFGKETMAIQTCFDNKRPSDSDYVPTYENRCNLLLQPRGGQVYISKNLTEKGNTNYSLLVEGRTSLNNDIAATNTGESSQLVISNKSNSGNNDDDVGLELWRGEHGSIQIINHSNDLFLRYNQYNNATQNTYVDGLQMAAGDGAITIFSTTDATSIETSSALWIKGGLAVDKKAYIGDDLMLYTRDSDRSIIFGYDKDATAATKNGAAWRLVAQGHGSGNTNYFSLQSSRSVAGNNKTWNDVARFGMDEYDAMFGPYGKIILDGVGPIAAGTQGETIVAIGNDIATATANNGRGRIRLFGTNTYYNDLMPMDNTANRWYHLPITPVDDAYLVGAWKRESTTSAHTDLNTLVDTGFYSIPGGFIDHGPGAQYGSVITGGYRKPYGNTTSDHSFQIFVATDGAQRIHFRTSKSTAWEAWRELAHIPNNTKTGDTNKGVYVAANGVVTAMTYTLDAKIDAGTANRIAWYKGNNEIAAGAATTDGQYLGNVSYLSVNTAHQTTYRFRVSGISYFGGGNVIVADTLRPEATRKRSLGLADYYWNAAWIYGNGNIHENALYWGGIGNANVTSTDYSISTPSVERGITAFKYPNGIPGNRVFGFPAEYTTVQYTTDGGNSWADVTDPWYTADRIRNLFNFNETQIPVGNLDKFDFTASQTTSPCSVGMGIQVTADFTKDNRVFYLNAFETLWRAYCCTCICRVEIYRANTSEWITLREDTISNSDTRRFVHLGQNWYCDGGRTNRNGAYFNKMRWTILVTAVGTSNTRYVPSLGACHVYGINGGNFSAGNFTPNGGTAQVNKYGTRMAWSMMRFNSPIYVSSYLGLGAASIGAATLYVGDDLRWTAAGTDKYSSLILGNNKSIDNEDAHSRGRIYIYNNKTGCNVVYSAANHAGSYNNYLGKADGYIAIGGNGSSTGVGDIGTPIYLNVNGVLTPCTAYANASVLNASYLRLYEDRGVTTNLNKTANYGAAGAMFHLVATSSTTTGKPSFDANVLQMNWDNNGGFDSQLAISTTESRMQFRSQVSSGLAWREVVTTAAATAVGSANQPVYINNKGQVVACNAYSTIDWTNIQGMRSYHYDGSSDWASYAWHQVASATITGTYQDFTMTLLVSSGENAAAVGILTVRLRSDGSSAIETQQAIWNVIPFDIDPNLFEICYNTTTKVSTLWCKMKAQWAGWKFTVLENGGRTSGGAKSWTLLPSVDGHGSANYSGNINAASTCAVLRNAGWN